MDNDISTAVDEFLHENRTYGVSADDMAGVLINLAAATHTDVRTFIQAWRLDWNEQDKCYDQLPDDDTEEEVSDWLSDKWERVIQLLVDQSKLYTLEGPHSARLDYEVTRLDGAQHEPETP